MKRTAGTAAALTALVLLTAGCGGSAEAETEPAATARPLRVQGSIVVSASTLSQVAAIDPQECQATRSYDDIEMGAQVTVTDSTGKVVGLGRLAPPTVSGEGLLKLCTFGFSVPGVPAGAGFYAVEVASRGQVRFPEAQLAQPVSLTLGS